MLTQKYSYRKDFKTRKNPKIKEKPIQQKQTKAKFPANNMRKR